MDSREICIWTDKRWYAALSSQLGEGAVEEKLKQYLDQLIHQLPHDQYETISAEIQAEEQKSRQAWEASRTFSIFRVKENGREEYFKVEPDTHMLRTAFAVRKYLRHEPGWQTASYAELYSDREPVSADEFGGLLRLHIEDPKRIVSVFDLDFDKGEFSTTDVGQGWKSYTIKDISTAAYHAYRNKNASLKLRWDRLADHLSGREITSAGHLSEREISFAEEITAIDDLLDFYMETCFDVDAVFGTHVCTSENDDTLNVYANYDMTAGQVCGTLEVDMHWADGREESLEYRLNAAEKAVLLRKMDAYCQKQTGQTLKEYSARLMAEEEKQDTVPAPQQQEPQTGRPSLLM